MVKTGKKVLHKSPKRDKITFKKRPPGVAAQYQSGVACSNRFPCGMGGLKLTNCVEVCTHIRPWSVDSLDGGFFTRQSHR